MEIGISTYLYVDDIFRGLESLKAIGYKFIEINTRCLPHPFLGKREDVARIARLVDSLGLEVSSIHIGNNPGDIGSSNPELKQEAIEWIKRSLDPCQVFKPQYVGIHHGGHTEDLSDPVIFESAKERITESLAELADFSRERGIKLAVENGGVFDAKTLKQVIRSLPEPDVGILVDTGHAWKLKLGRDPAQEIREAGGRLFILHIHDNHGEKDEHLVPGEGTINWRDVLKALGEVGYQGVFMMECVHSKTTQDKDTIALLAKHAAERLLAAQD